MSWSAGAEHTSPCITSRWPPAQLAAAYCCLGLASEPGPPLAPQVLTTSEDLKTSACCTAGSPPPLVRDALKKVPDEVKAKYYGCGSPFPMGIQGLR